MIYLPVSAIAGIVLLFYFLKTERGTSAHNVVSGILILVSVCAALVVIGFTGTPIVGVILAVTAIIIVSRL